MLVVCAWCLAWITVVGCRGCDQRSHGMCPRCASNPKTMFNGRRRQVWEDDLVELGGEG